jgi:hypothetical protein
MEMTDAARLMIGLAFISLPTIAFGGYLLLSILRRQAGTEKISEVQKHYFRAGHAHAGVLVILSIVAQFALDSARLPEAVTWAARIGVFAAPLLISGGFFGGAPRTPDGKPAGLVRLIPAGAVVLSLSTIVVGIGMLLPPAA